ncbi:major facilitator superfamily permease [Paramagnetospirillum caucaseum]|uniref:Bcr/CflA family efflux transporter n=1 Tax=Paramagnetospirillum caucaseum TaxID=1244869 RepID=M3AGN8_9PROT|nr:major facilitator superfamily permease [Paramagnetospirillum caucaseum]
MAFGPVCTDLYLASLPDMARDLATTTTMVQLTLSAFVGGFAVAQLVYGPLSDRFGRRPMILGGIVLYVAASLYCVVAPSIEALIAGRFVQALGACCGPVLGRAVVRDLFASEQAAKVMSYMASAMALGPLVAPTVGGWFHTWFGWRSNFVLLALFGIVLMVLVWRMLGETNRHKDPRALDPGRMLGNFRELLTHRLFLGYVLTMTAAFGGLFSFISASSFVLIDVMGMEPRFFGLAFALASAGYLIGGFAGARLTHRFGVDRMVFAGTIGCTATGFALAAVVWSGLAKPGGMDGVAMIMGLVMAYFIACALVLPNATAGAIAPFPRAAGAASSAMGFIQMAGGAVAGWLVGHFHDGSARPLAAMMAVMGLAALLVYLKVVRPAARR